MTFVQNTVVPVDSLQILNIVTDHVVRHDNNIVLGDRSPQLLPLCWSSGIHDRLEVVGVLKNLVVPVSCQSGWTDNDRGAVGVLRELGLCKLGLSIVLVTRQHADGL